MICARAWPTVATRQRNPFPPFFARVLDVHWYSPLQPNTLAGIVLSSSMTSQIDRKTTSFPIHHVWNSTHNWQLQNIVSFLLHFLLHSWTNGAIICVLPAHPFLVVPVCKSADGRVRSNICTRGCTVTALAALWKRLYSAKETYNFKEFANRNHPIVHFRRHSDIL